MIGYTCGTCGQYHPDLPMHYGAWAPTHLSSIPEIERDRRCELSSDQCIIDNRRFFIVGNLEIHVHGLEDRFSWDVWVELAEKHFDTSRLWNRRGRESERPYPSKLSTGLPGYPDAIGLRAMVQTREVGRRPLVILEPTEHPLYVEQRNGITVKRAQ